MCADQLELPRRTVVKLTALGLAGTSLGSQGSATSYEPAQEWTTALGDPGNRSYIPSASGPPASLENLWQEASIVRAPTVANGMVYGVGNEAVLALDIGTGESDWKFSAEGGSANPAYRTGSVYCTVEETGSVHELAAADGSETWSYVPDQLSFSLPVVSETLVYFPVGPTLYALDPDSDDPEWELEFEQGVTTEGALEDETLVFGMGQELIAVDASEGTERWRQSTAERFSVAPAIADQTVYAVDGSLRALDASDGDEAWRVESDLFATTPTVGDDRVYVVGGDLDSFTDLVAIDRTDGSELWRFEADSDIPAPPSLGADTLYVASESGTLSALDPADGERRWEIDVGEQPRQPVVVGEYLYVTSSEHGLQVFGEPDEPADAGGDPTEDDDTVDVDDEAGDAQSGDDDGFGPGLGLLSALAGLGGAGYLLRKRLVEASDEESG